MKPVREFRITQRNLPHWQDPGSVYFVTRRVDKGRLFSASDRTIALDAILFWHEKKWFVYTAVVMPDHAHVLARMLPLQENDDTVDVGEVVGSVKKFSARRINIAQKRTGLSLWQDERYDRIQRNGTEFEDTWNYIRENPVAANLVHAAEQYQWLFEGGNAD